MRAALLCIATIACTSASSNPGTTAPPAPPTTPELLGSMATLAGMVPDDNYLTDWATRIDGGKAKLGDFIDELLRNERFGTEVIPSLVFGSYVNVRNYFAAPASFVLKRSQGSPLYLRKPCTKAEGVVVKPWWAIDGEVLVCPDAYRPEKWTVPTGEHGYKTDKAIACDSQIGSPESEQSAVCGCGPNLIRCLRDEEQYHELNASLMSEVKQTTAHVVNNDLPMASLFTSNATFRDRNAELYYRRQKINAVEDAKPEAALASLAKWPHEGKWAPREELLPGQHAGVLTSGQLLHWQPDRRQRQRLYYEVLWCNLKNSFGATTHKVLEINSSGNNSFSHDSWKKLAHTELCTNCHARLDYGFQFFLGYRDSRASTYFDPALVAKGNGPLYGEAISDPRGEAPLTPLGFAKLATAQPDFKSCMAEHFTQYVLGSRATVDDRRAIDAAVRTDGPFKAPMKVALERFAKQWSEARPVAAVPASGVASQPGPNGGVLVSGALRGKLDTHCVDCHDKSPYNDDPDTPDVAFDFTGGELPRPLLVSMADQVAFGMMPKSSTLDLGAREDIVRIIVDALWTDPKARDEALGYYLGGARGLPALQFDNAVHAIQRRAGAPSMLPWGALERGIWTDQSTTTPGFFVVTGLEAMRSCVKAGEIGDRLEPCLIRATALDGLTRWPVR